MARFTVTNTIKASDGTALASVNVNIKLMPSGGFLADAKSEVVRELNVTTNASGVWTASLESNLNIQPPNTWYEVLERIPKSYGGNRTWVIQVLLGAGTLSELLITELPPPAVWVPTSTVTVVKTVWIDLPLNNGVVPLGQPTYWPPQYRLFDDRIEMRGLAKLGDSLSTWPANQVIATLPVGFRPSRQLRFPVNAVAVGQTDSSALFAVCYADGTISPQLTWKNAHMFFDGINFSIV
jgi:hypothetical protein